MDFVGCLTWLHSLYLVLYKYIAYMNFNPHYIFNKQIVMPLLARFFRRVYFEYWDQSQVPESADVLGAIRYISSEVCWECFFGLFAISFFKFKTFHLTAGKSMAPGNPIRLKSGSPACSDRKKSAAFPIKRHLRYSNRNYSKIPQAPIFYIPDGFALPRK